MRHHPVTPFVPLLALALGAPAAAAGLPPAAPGDLTITEFMAELDTVPAYYGEWIELHNNTDRDIDLFGLRLDGSSDDEGIEIDESIVVGPGAYVLLGVDDDPDRNGNIAPAYVYDFSKLTMDHTEDELQISYEGLVVDQVAWTSSSWDVIKQHSEQLNVYMLGLEWANDLPQSWCQSRALYGAESWYGTPGLANGICDGSNGDADGDGFSEANGDCNDLDPAVNPDATDGDTSPDGEPDDDADCDGVRDDGAIDDDGDGFAEVSGDCDDTDSAVSPGEEEIADGVDNDCDGCIDDFDLDGDGWTACDSGAVVDCNAEDTVVCTAELLRSGDYVEGSCAFAFDCDDSEDSVQPCEADVAYDAVDQSCDGIDRCDQDNDGYNATPSACLDGVDCCADPRTGAPGEDCDDVNRDVNPGQVEGDPDQGGIPDGLDNDCNGVVDDPYLDRDNDGYTEAEGDCFDSADDPAAASQNPGAAEVCGDRLDNDCDGMPDDGCLDPALFASVSGGGLLCATSPGAGGLGALATALLALLRRRKDNA